MKKHFSLIFTIALLLCTAITKAQAPQGFNYQAVIRDGSGNLITSGTVSMRFSVLQGNSSGIAVYQETQSVTPNSYGLVTAVIGGGTLVSGSGAFNAIGWATNTYYLMVEADPTGASNYVSLGTPTQFQSVPYALSAGGSSGSGWGLTGNAGTTFGTNYIGTSDTNNLMFKINGNQAGFLESSSNYSSAFGNLALANEIPYGSNYNIAFGNHALNATSIGKNNAAFGVQALEDNQTGGSNTAAGNLALEFGATGQQQTALGLEAMRNCNGRWNLAAGDHALLESVSDSENTAVGSYALAYHNSGNHETGIGDNALLNDTTGYDNTGLGANTNVIAQGLHNATAVGYNTKLSQSNTLILGNGVSVGIGTTNPNYPLDVQSVASNAATIAGYLYNAFGPGTVANSNYDVSINAAGAILSPNFLAQSDARIKHVIGRTDNANDLNTLMKINITDYKYIDQTIAGNNIIKKVIAQEVEQVYPTAVNKSTNVIPNIYTLAEINNGVVTVKNDLKAGDKVKLIFDKRIELAEVTEANATMFKVNLKDEGKVFVYGKQVNDFRTVDYEALGTLNISATQQLAKEVDALKAENAALKTDNTEMKAANASLKNDVELIKSQLGIHSQLITK